MTIKKENKYGWGILMLILIAASLFMALLSVNEKLLVDREANRVLIDSFYDVSDKLEMCRKDSEFSNKILLAMAEKFGEEEVMGVITNMTIEAIAIYRDEIEWRY